MTNTKVNRKIAIIGGGFTGLSLAYYLAKSGKSVTIFEKDPELGGLAGSFIINNRKIEKFYHHWFTNDLEVMSLIEELGLTNKIKINETNTSIFYGNKFYKMSSPYELLKFKPLSFINRIRLGLLTLYVRSIKDWRSLEKKTASQWLKDMGGSQVYRIVWEPLLRGKFGEFSDSISAVWIWNKLKLRGSSRNKRGKENLAYFEGGFSALIDKLSSSIIELGGIIYTNQKVTDLILNENYLNGIISNGNTFNYDTVISTIPLPETIKIIEKNIDIEYLKKLKKIKYLANICIVIEIKFSLSDTYWMNVNDPGFPFVAVIEHTNFESNKNYGGSNIIYLSKYLPETDILFMMQDEELLEFTILHLQRMFPKFNKNWIITSNVWRARNSQPIVTKNYSDIIPKEKTPINNFYILTMAQIYPEDRGTNYAIRQGKNFAEILKY